MTDDFAPRKPGAPEGTQPVNAGTVLLGVALTLGLHIACGGLFALGAGLVSLVVRDAEIASMFMLFFIGVAQLPWMVPAWIIARRRGLHGIAIGLIIGAAVTFLVNSACFGMLMYSGIH